MTLWQCWMWCVCLLKSCKWHFNFLNCLFHIKLYFKIIIIPSSYGKKCTSIISTHDDYFTNFTFVAVAVYMYVYILQTNLSYFYINIMPRVIKDSIWLYFFCSVVTAQNEIRIHLVVLLFIINEIWVLSFIIHLILYLICIL